MLGSGSSSCFVRNWGGELLDRQVSRLRKAMKFLEKSFVTVSVRSRLPWCCPLEIPCIAIR
jgi:hypothetical protein